MKRIVIMAIFIAILLIAPLIPASIALLTTLVVEEVLSVALTPISNTTPPRGLTTMSTPTLLRHAPMLAHQPYSRPSETTITKEMQYKVRIIIIIYMYYIHIYTMTANRKKLSYI